MWWFFKRGKTNQNMILFAFSLFLKLCTPDKRCSSACSKDSFASSCLCQCVYPNKTDVKSPNTKQCLTKEFKIMVKKQKGAFYFLDGEFVCLQGNKDRNSQGSLWSAEGNNSGGSLEGNSIKHDTSRTKSLSAVDGGVEDGDLPAIFNPLILKGPFPLKIFHLEGLSCTSGWYCCTAGMCHSLYQEDQFKKRLLALMSSWTLQHCHFFLTSVVPPLTTAIFPQSGTNSIPNVMTINPKKQPNSFIVGFWLQCWVDVQCLDSTVTRLLAPCSVTIGV